MEEENRPSVKEYEHEELEDEARWLAKEWPPTEEINKGAEVYNRLMVVAFVLLVTGVCLIVWWIG